MAVAGSAAAFLALLNAAPSVATCGSMPFGMYSVSMLARVAKEGWARSVTALLKNCSAHNCRFDVHNKNLISAVAVASTEEILLNLWKSSNTATLRGAVMKRAAAMEWYSALEHTLYHWKKYPPKSNARGPQTHHASEIMGALQVASVGQVVLWLVQAYPKIACSFVGREVMWRSVEQGWATVLYRLIKNGASVNSVGREGSTPLHVAIAKGHVECVRILAGNGASMSLKDDDGWTPLHCAAEKDNREMVIALLKAGADPNIKDPFGLTCVDVATSKGIVALLKGGESAQENDAEDEGEA